jgi:hypothetical protein
MSLFRSPSCKPLRRSGKQRLVLPSHRDKVTCHHLSRSPRHRLHYGASPRKEGSSRPGIKCRRLSIPSRRVVDEYTCLTAAKTSLKVDLARSRPMVALSSHAHLLQSFPKLGRDLLKHGWLEYVYDSLGEQPASQPYENDPMGGIYRQPKQ